MLIKHYLVKTLLLFHHKQKHKFKTGKKMKRNIVALAILGAFSISAQAADVGAAVSFGTTGIGAHLSVPVAEKINARFGVNAFDYSYDGSTSNVNYDFKLKMRTLDALLDYHPYSNGFRLSAGAIYNGNKITATGKPVGGATYTLNGRTYAAATVGQLNGDVDFRKVAPYLGLGWGNAAGNAKGGFAFAADLGVMFQGTPRTSLNNTGCQAATAICQQLATDVSAENLRLREEAKDFKAFPVVRVGVSYRF